MDPLGKQTPSAKRKTHVTNGFCDCIEGGKRLNIFSLGCIQLNLLEIQRITRDVRGTTNRRGKRYFLVCVLDVIENSLVTARHLTECVRVGNICGLITHRTGSISQSFIFLRRGLAKIRPDGGRLMYDSHNVFRDGYGLIMVRYTRVLQRQLAVEDKLNVLGGR